MQLTWPIGRRVNVVVQTLTSEGRDLRIAEGKCAGKGAGQPICAGNGKRELKGAIFTGWPHVNMYSTYETCIQIWVVNGV